MTALRLLISAGILAIPGTISAQASRADSARTTGAGIYTAAQAAEGRSTYQFSCTNCHSPATHSGPTFAGRWNGRLLWELYHFVSEAMPKSEPGSLSEKEYLGVVAYLLKLNGMPAGAEPLSSDSTALKKIRIAFVRQDSTQQR